MLELAASGDPPAARDGNEVTTISSDGGKSPSSDGEIKKGKKSKTIHAQDWSSGVDFVRRNIEVCVCVCVEEEVVHSKVGAFTSRLNSMLLHVY